MTKQNLRGYFAFVMFLLAFYTAAFYTTVFQNGGKEVRSDYIVEEKVILRRTLTV